MTNLKEVVHEQPVEKSFIPVLHWLQNLRNIKWIQWWANWTWSPSTFWYYLGWLHSLWFRRWAPVRSQMKHSPKKSLFFKNITTASIIMIITDNVHCAALSWGHHRKQNHYLHQSHHYDDNQHDDDQLTYLRRPRGPALPYFYFYFKTKITFTFTFTFQTLLLLLSLSLIKLFSFTFPFIFTYN